jgi:hypothetical protein
MTGARLALGWQARCNQLVCLIREGSSCRLESGSRCLPLFTVGLAVDHRRKGRQRGFSRSPRDGHRRIATQAHTNPVPHEGNAHVHVSAGIQEQALIHRSFFGQLALSRRCEALIPDTNSYHSSLGDDRLSEKVGSLIEKLPEFLQIAGLPIVPKLLPQIGPRHNSSYPGYAKRHHAGHQNGNLAHKLSVKAESVRSLGLRVEDPTQRDPVSKWDPPGVYLSYALTLAREVAYHRQRGGKPDGAWLSDVCPTTSPWDAGVVIVDCRGLAADAGQSALHLAGADRCIEDQGHGRGASRLRHAVWGVQHLWRS